MILYRHLLTVRGLFKLILRMYNYLLREVSVDSV